MLKIRLVRFGKKKQPFYRITVAESKTPLRGRFVEVIGNYNPKTKDLKVDKEKAEKWLGLGAQPSEKIKTLLKKSGVIIKES